MSHCDFGRILEALRVLLDEQAAKSRRGTFSCWRLARANPYSVAEITLNTVHDIFVSARRRKEAMPDASLTDDNAAMAEIAGTVFTVISAMLY